MTSINNTILHKITTPKKRKNGSESNSFSLVKKIKFNNISRKDSIQTVLNKMCEPSPCNNEDDGDLFFFDISGNKNNLYTDATSNEFILNETKNQVSSKLAKLNDSFILPKKVKKKNQPETIVDIRDSECEITDEYMLYKKKPRKKKKKKSIDQSETNHTIDQIKVLVNSADNYNKKIDKEINNCSGHSTNQETRCFDIPQKLISHIDFNTKKKKKKKSPEAVVDITYSDCEVKNVFLPYKKNEKNEIMEDNIAQIKNCDYKSKRKLKKKLSAIDSSSSKENMEFNIKVNIGTSKHKITTENLTDSVGKKMELDNIHLIKDLGVDKSIENVSNECMLHHSNFHVSYRSQKKHKNKKIKSENIVDLKPINIEFSINKCLDPTSSTNSSLNKEKVRNKKYERDINGDNKYKPERSDNKNELVLDDNFDEGIMSLSDSSSYRRNNEDNTTNFVPNHKENVKRGESKKTFIDDYIIIQKTKRKIDSDSIINSEIKSIPLRKSQKKISEDAYVEHNAPIKTNSFFIEKKKEISEGVKEDHTIGCEYNKVFSKEDCCVPDEVTLKGFDNIKNLNWLKSKKIEGNDNTSDNTKNSADVVTSSTRDICNKMKANIDLSKDLTMKKSVDSESNESILYQSGFQASFRSDKKHKKRKSKSENIVDLKPINVGVSDNQYLNPSSNNSPLGKKRVKNGTYKLDINNDNKYKPEKARNKNDDTVLDNNFDEGIMSLSDSSSSKRSSEENIANYISKRKENSNKRKTKKTFLDNQIQNTKKESGSDSIITPLKEIVKENLDHAIGDKYNKVFAKKEYSIPDERPLKGYDDIRELNWLKSKKRKRNDNAQEEILDIKTSEYDVTSCTSDIIVYKKKSKKKDRSNGKLNAMDQIVPENLIVSSDDSEIMSPLEIVENCLKPNKSKYTETGERNDDICKEIIDVQNSTYEVANCDGDTISPIKTFKYKIMDKLLKREQKMDKIFDIGANEGAKQSGDTEEGISEVKIFEEFKMNNNSPEDFLSGKDATNEEDVEIFSKIKREDTGDIEKLKLLDIQLPFSVAPLHSILTRTSKPTDEQLKQIKLSNIEVKTGPFSKEEDEKIIKNWNNFCKEYDLNKNSLVIVSFPRRLSMLKKTNILRYLGHGLDNRMLHRIHARFKTLMQKPYVKMGRYTAEEDKMILDYVSETSSSHPFRDLSEILNRDNLSIEKRYDLLTRDKIDKIMWTPEMVDKFITCMKQVTKCEKTKHLKSVQLTTKQWKKLSKKLENIPIKKLQQAWKITIYPRLYTKEVDMQNMKKKIVDILCERNETDWRTTNWREISSGFKGFTPEKIYMIFKKLVINHVPEDKQKSLEECVRYLKRRIQKYSSISSSHKFRKFVYHNGHLVYENKKE